MSLPPSPPPPPSSPAPAPGEPDDADLLAPGVRVRRSALVFTFVRGSGPGGQAVNKLSTTAQLRVALSAIEGLSDRAGARLRRLAGRRLTEDGEILFRSGTHRSQLDNRRACLERLRALVAEAVKVPRVRRKKRPTRAMIERRLESKRQRSEKKGRRRWRGDD